MPEYRACIIGLDGHILKAVEFICDDDSAAMKKAEQLVEARDVVIWEQNRKVARLKRRITPAYLNTADAGRQWALRTGQ